jgi:hypothetical protein
MGLFESLMDSEVSSSQQEVLMKMGSVDLIVCQGSSREIPYFQVGRDKQMRLSEGLINSEVSLNQPEELTEEEDLRSLLMIGGIQIFLPFSQEEAEICVADAATITPWEMELEMLEDWLNNPEPVGDCHEQVLAEEHSEESLRDFSQGAEKVMKTAEMESVAGWQVEATKEDEEEFQPREQLEKVGDIPAKGMIVEALSYDEDEEDEQIYLQHENNLTE